MPEQKTFKVRCVKCEKPFHVRFELSKPEADGSGDVAVDCMHCSEKLMITIPQQYIGKEEILRSRSVKEQPL